MNSKDVKQIFDYIFITLFFLTNIYLIVGIFQEPNTFVKIALAILAMWDTSLIIEIYQKINDDVSLEE